MNRKAFFLTTFLVVFIDMLGVSLIIPILAPLFLSPTGMLPNASLQAQTLMLGLLIAIFPIMQFFGAPILGALSDRHGRKPILLISLFGTLLGYILFAIGIMRGSLELLFIGRAIDGFTGGNIAIVLSSIADMSDEKEKGRNFGLVGMAFGFGFIIGPFVGGVLSDPTIVSWFTFATPFWVAATLSLLNIIFVGKLFQETLQNRRATPISAFTGFHNLAKAMRMRHLRLMFIVIFLLTFGFAFFAQFSQVYYIQQFNMTQRQIGYLFAYTGLWIAFTQGVLMRPVSRRFSAAQMLTVSIPVLAVAIACILLPKHMILLYVITPFIAMSNGFTYPNTTAIVSNLSAKDSQGEIMGINQSLQAAAGAIPPIIAGLIAAMHSTLPILGGTVAIACAYIAFLQFKKTRPTEKFHEV